MVWGGVYLFIVILSIVFLFLANLVILGEVE